MFKKKIKCDEQIIKLIEEKMKQEIESANNSLDLYNETQKDLFIQDYWMCKGRFTMCQTLLAEIEFMCK